MRLADKSIVVTGATGIAAAGARRASAEGARIFAISLDEVDCRGLVRSIEGEGGLAFYAVADLTVEAEAVLAIRVNHRARPGVFCRPKRRVRS